MGQLNESSGHIAVMSIVSESCVGAWPLPNAPCLVSAVANIKAQSLWEDVSSWPSTTKNRLLSPGAAGRRLRRWVDLACIVNKTCPNN